MRWFDPPEGKDVPQRRFTDRAIWAVVAAFVVLAGMYSVVTPLFEAPDELFHYPYVKHLADGHGLPVLDPSVPGLWNQEGGQPPLYYALAALVSRWVPSDNLAEITQRNPHASIGFVQRDGNANIVLHIGGEAFPYRGAALAVHLARLLSVALGAVTVMFTYRLGLEALPTRPGLALAGAAVVAFTPMFVFISGSVNNDNLVITLATVSLWLMLRLLRLPLLPARWLLLGALIGLAALSKVSGLGLLGMAVLVLAWVAWRGGGWRVAFRCGVCVAGAAVLVAGWWYARNWLLYRDPLGWNAFIAVIGPRGSRPTLGALLGECPGLFKSYWGVFGWFNVTAPAWFYALCAGLVLLGMAGMLIGAARRLWRRSVPDVDALFRLGVIAAWPCLVTVSLVRWTLLTPASQGRLLFPAIASLSYLLVVGWAELWAILRAAYWVLRKLVSGRACGIEQAHTPRITHYAVRSTQYAICLAPLALMASLAIWTPFGVIAPAYARPPLLSAEQIAAIPHRLDLVLGDQMELLGYDIGASEVRPGQELPVTLYWRARWPMNENYSVFVHLLSDDEIIISQRDTHPGGGSFPTTQWRPGDAIADTYIIPVSPTAFSPSHAVLEVGLYNQATGVRLPIRDASGVPVGEQVRFGQVLVRAEPKDGIGNPLKSNFDNQMALVGYDLDRTALHPGETLHLTLFWKALAPMDRNYTVFAHVLGQNNSIWGQKDAWPQDGAAPTSTWRVGQLVTDHYDLVVKPETPPGVYDIEVGVYLGETLKRLSVLGAGGTMARDCVLLSRVRVVP